jgi:hypothetical protein
MSSKFELLKKYIEVVVKQSKAHSFLVLAERGIGKTYCVLEALENQKLKRGKDFVYNNGNITPLALFKLLSKYQDKIVVLDDIEGVLSNKVALSIIKGALSEVGRTGKRLVSYHTSQDIDTKKTFDFTGKIILILNSASEKNSIGRSLLDRTIFFDMRITNKELIARVDEIIPDIDTELKLEEKQEVWEKIKPYAFNSRFSLRALIRAFSFYSQDKKGWFRMFLNTLDMNDEERIMCEIDDEDISTEAKIKKYQEKTGKSRRSFYRAKKK